MSQHQSQSGAFASSFATTSSFASPRLTEKGRTFVAELAGRHGFDESAVTSMLIALQRGGGGQAQFDHPQFGGMGQWSRGGMLMIGDMFNDALKSKVGALAQEAAAGLSSADLFEPSFDLSATSPWPREFGLPAATGSQNDMHYAFFPESRRLAIKRNGVTELYDTGDHQIAGFAQQQGGSATLEFASQQGPVSLTALRRIDGATEVGVTETSPIEPEFGRTSARDTGSRPNAAGGPDDRPTDQASIIATIEGIAALHAKGILSDDEFAAKKAELLGRL